MTRYNPTGLDRMNMNGMSEDAFIAHAKRAKYLSCVMIDALHMNKRLNEEAGVLYSIARIYGFDPRPDNDNPAHVKAYAEARYQDLKNLRRDAKTPNLHYYIQNERGFEKRDFMMFCELLKLSIDDKEGVIGLAFWNGASGAVMTGFWGQPNQWAEPWAIEFLKLMHKFRNVRLKSGAYAFILCPHNYTSQYSLIAVNAGQNRKKKGDSRNLWQTHQDFLDGTKYIDWRLAQDHLGRDYQGIMRALGYEPVDEGRYFAPTDDTLRDENGQYIMCPWLLPTEVGRDNMNDVSGVHGDELIPMAANVAVPVDDEFIPMTRAEEAGVGRYGLAKWLIIAVGWLEKLWMAFTGTFAALATFSPRGYRSLAKTWLQASWFPGKPAGYTFAWQMTWEWKVIHSITEVTIAQIVFCEGWTSQQWLSYFVTGDTDYLKFMESDDARVDIPEHFLRAVVTPPPPPTEPPAPPVSDLPTKGWVNENVKVYAHPLPANIYDSKSGGKVIGTVHSEHGEAASTVYILENGRQPVKLGTISGWLDRNHGWFKPDEYPFDIKPTDPRIGDYKAFPHGLVSPVNVQQKPGRGIVVGSLRVGGVDVVKHVPFAKLTDAEQIHVTRLQGRYAFVILANGATGFVPEKDVNFEPLVTTPPLETVTISVTRLKELEATEKAYEQLQIKVVTTAVTIGQAASKLKQVGKAYDDAAQLLQGSTGDLNDAEELLSSITKGETLQ